MSDAWIYAEVDEPARQLAAHLAELGFTPRRANGTSSLEPNGASGEAPARGPALALVVATPGQPPPVELMRRVRREQRLEDVPLLLAVGTEHLNGSEALTEADELLVEPFLPTELELRIARARRELSGVEDDVVRAGSLEVNLATYQVTVAGKPIDFAYMEYELLKFLMTHPRRAFPREALLARVWRYDYYGGARTVDVHVRRLRAKLGPEHAARLKTVRGVGYRFDP